MPARPAPAAAPPQPVLLFDGDCGLCQRVVRVCLVRLRGDEHAPHRAQHHPEMAPVVGVDDEAFADGAKKGREDRKIAALPGHADEEAPKAHDHGGEGQGGIAHAGQPAA